MKSDEKLHVFFSGGGTLGPITPLIAIERVLLESYDSFESRWVITRKGIEGELLENENRVLHRIYSGKLRRYLSFLNVIDLFKLFVGFWQSLYLLWRHAPDLCISAGGFTSVPLHAAAWILHIPTWVHGQDIYAGLANKVMAPLATKVTVALKEGAEHLPAKKVEWSGNPVRNDILGITRKQGHEKLNLDPHLETLLIFGGGTGSERINEITLELLHESQEYQIVHIVGLNRPWEAHEKASSLYENYYPYMLLRDEMKYAYAAADLVVSRAGFGTLSECAALKKDLLVFPLSGPQEQNAQYLKNKNAVVTLDEKLTDGRHLAQKIRELLEDDSLKGVLGQHLHTAIPQMTEDDIKRTVKDAVSKT